jgi:hypothetical protein
VFGTKRLIILEQPLDVIELDLRALRIRDEAAAEFFQNAANRCTSISQGILTE